MPNDNDDDDDDDPDTCLARLKESELMEKKSGINEVLLHKVRIKGTRFLRI